MNQRTPQLLPTPKLLRHPPRQIIYFLIPRKLLQPLLWLVVYSLNGFGNQFKLQHFAVILVCCIHLLYGFHTKPT